MISKNMNVQVCPFFLVQDSSTFSLFVKNLIVTYYVIYIFLTIHDFVTII